MQVNRHGIIAIAAPIVAIAVMTFWLTGYGSQAIDEILPQRLPEVTIEQVTFEDSMILLNVRNTGLLEVEIAMADVNDRIQPAAVEPDGKLGRFESAIIRIPFEWNEAEPYSVGVTTDDGTRFVREIEAAAQVPERGIKLVGTLAILGVYVGIIPVMVGLLWSPFIRRAGFERYAFFLSLTVGMLFFIGIDSIFAASEVAAENLSDSFDGIMLVATVSVISFLTLYYVERRLAGMAGMSGPLAAGIAISTGIGLHNLGEGLAIGAAIGLGQAALGAFLIVGFALHNTTEGVAIAASQARGRTSILRLGLLGAIAGVPAVFGTLIGGIGYSPFAAVVFLSLAGGAVFQVILLVLQMLRTQNSGQWPKGFAMPAGIMVGMLVMYLTGLIVANTCRIITIQDLNHSRNSC